ncbi:MAG: 4Fe-4S dicluster domain-containing protein [Deferribacteraceae bacterium]|jgi:anaerobic dimethyl sulfoxide reductase subunit B (iron-sulfur subunit)|nr:4Fe-4S dicluster domain-containing protein [Deferribacteraceae bacterium]
MSQWGFYFNQDRCIGCKTCLTACKNWNDARRGDAEVNELTVNPNLADSDNRTDANDYIDSATGATNYARYRKYYMKEQWRRVETAETGAITTDEKGIFRYNLDRRYLSIGCNHCEDPACVKVCPTGSIYKESTIGAVLVNNINCISCGRCKDACPWSAPQFYSENYRDFALSDPARPKMTKCTLCLERVKDGRRPACVAACWNRALDADTLEQLAIKYPGSPEALPEFESDYVEALGSNTNPSILFKAKS